MMFDQFMNILRQFLDAHIFIKLRRFAVQCRQNVFDAQVQVKGAFKFSERAQQAQSFGFVDTNAEQEQQVVWTGFFYDDAAFIEIFGDQTCRNTEFIHRTVFLHPRRQDSDFDRVEVHVFVIDIFEAMPCAI
ncbi:Uncharacterised protein [Salmonella enterica subsp. enterica serovar Bovismorbificans]|uniref:Uncharacterized protein n=1 Tax=Salmonella enterica subsp. enterica serovar Bovismorbificans TaxID=58097 RepID=A0A655DGF6_SALET|nr:Uncharacterised protein [Salmonella enterica subsp. enterica serovar Bovismorbificans]